MPENLAPQILDRSTEKAPSTGAVVEPDAPSAPEVVTAETLVEEVSIDGMCGVY